MIFICKDLFTFTCDPPPPPPIFHVGFSSNNSLIFMWFFFLTHALFTLRVSECITTQTLSSVPGGDASLTSESHSETNVNRKAGKPRGDLFIVSTSLSVKASLARPCVHSAQCDKRQEITCGTVCRTPWGVVPMSAWYYLGAVWTSVTQMPVSPQCGYSCVSIAPVSRAACRAVHFICTAAPCWSAAGLNAALNRLTLTLNSWPFSSLHATIL